MTTPPKLKTKFGENIGVELAISHPELGSLSTFFASSTTVDNGLKFLTKKGEYVLLGSFGSEKSEIARIHTSTDPTATTITFNSSTSFTHNRGEMITLIPYNQIHIQSSSDNVTYSDLATIDIQPSIANTYYNDASGTAATYYRFRFKNSSSTTYSSYSDPVLGNGFVTGTVGHIINDALVTLGEEIDEVITKEFLYAAINEGREELDQHQDVDKWAFRTVFDYAAGTVIPGQNTLTLPTNLRDPQTYKNVLSVRIGKEKYPLTKTDKEGINRWYRGVAQATLSSSITSGSNSLVLSASGDFDASGTVDIAASTVSQTIDTVTYTGNDLSTTLSGVTGIADSKSSGVKVWQDASYGYPTEYTVDNGVMTFSCPFSDEMAGEKIWLDYYKVLTEVNSDSDTFDEPSPRIYLPYLRYRIKLRRNKGLDLSTDVDFATWEQRKKAAVSNNFLGQDVRVRINVPV